MWEARPKSWLKSCNDQLCMYVTYLIGHNNPINGFWPATTHSSKHLDLVLPMHTRPSFLADFRRLSHQIPVSPEYPLPYKLHAWASAAAEYWYAAQRLCRCEAHTARYKSNPKIIAFLSNILKAVASVLNKGSDPTFENDLNNYWIFSEISILYLKVQSFRLIMANNFI